MRQYFTDDTGTEYASLQIFEHCIALYVKGFALSSRRYPVRIAVRALLSHRDSDPIQKHWCVKRHP